MSDQPDHQSGTDTEVTAAVAPWSEGAPSPAWEQIVDQAEFAAPGPAGPGAAPEPAPTEVQPATEAGRSRRPTSLRQQYVQDGESVPRRKLAAPAFPSAPAVPGSPVTSPASEERDPGNPGPVPEASHGSHAAHLPNPASLLGRLPIDQVPTDKIAMDKLPLDKLPVDKLPLDRLRTLTKQRPEVGLGLAFAGGLMIATILKRLGRR